MYSQCLNNTATYEQQKVIIQLTMAYKRTWKRASVSVILILSLCQMLTENSVNLFLILFLIKVFAKMSRYDINISYAKQIRICLLSYFLSLISVLN